MDYSRSIFQRYYYEELSFPVPSNASLPSLFRKKWTFQDGYTMAQMALLLLPSAILLLMVPIRAFQLHRANLKVMPNYTGAIKAVSCLKGKEEIC